MANTITLTNAPITIYSGDDRFNPGTKRRTLFVTLDGLDALKDLDSKLFSIKISQSKNPDLSGKPVFKYFQYRLNSTDPWSRLAPPSTTLATPTEDIKNTILGTFEGKPDAEFELSIHMPGKWGQIETADGPYAIFDNEHFPNTLGDPNYYIRQGTTANVDLTPANQNGNEYFQINLSTDKTAKEIFVKRGRGDMKYYDAADAPEEDAPTTDSSASSDDDWI